MDQPDKIIRQHGAPAKRNLLTAIEPRIKGFYFGHIQAVRKNHQLFRRILAALFPPTDGGFGAGCGIAERLLRLLIRQGLEASEAAGRLWLIDRDGLLHEGLGQGHRR